MTLLGYEWRKLARMPALWAVLTLCAIFNCTQMLEIAPYIDLFNEAGEAASQLGQRVDGDFLTGLRQREQTACRDTLLEAVEGMDNVFETLDIQMLSAYYEKYMDSSPLAQSLMAWKYDMAEERAAHLARTGAAMDLYAGPVTTQVHQFLFGNLLLKVLMESAVLGMLSMLYLLGYEDIQRTTHAVCAARTGRKLWRRKVLAGAGAAVGLYAVLAGSALAAFFTVWDFSGIWSASVSSQFNCHTDLLIIRPFMTWADFSVAGYLAAVLLLGGVLVIVLALLAAVAGLLVRNVYLAGLVLMVLCTSGYAVGVALAELGWWELFVVFTFNPVLLLLEVNAWFTEVGMNTFIPWQETVGTVGGLALLSGGTALALRRFRRKDVLV